MRYIIITIISLILFIEILVSERSRFYTFLHAGMFKSYNKIIKKLKEKFKYQYYRRIRNLWCIKGLILRYFIPQIIYTKKITFLLTNNKSLYAIIFPQGEL
jgi:hypothetical protein